MKGNVLVTGASTGIGEDIAISLAKSGFKVYAGVRRLSDGENLSKQFGESIKPIIIDVTQSDQIQSAFEKIKSQGGLFALVNNAGVATGGPLEYLKTADLRAQFEVNVFGLHEVTKTFLPLLRQSKGRVIHIGSISGKFAFPFVGAYCASKHAVEALSDSLRRELAPHGVKVILIEPGRIRTPIWKKSLAQAQERRRNMPSQVETNYGQLLDRVENLTGQAQKIGAHPHSVSKTVLKALSSPSPRPRYVVGVDALVQKLIAQYLPDSFIDWFIRKIIRL